MSKATLLKPSRPIQCQPDIKDCPAGRNSVCQYSLRSFKYICCEDKEDAIIPTCPMYYETLLVACSQQHQCPNGYQCLPSLSDSSVSLCCKPDRSVIFKQPEMTFRENQIVPQILPKAPEFELKVTFGDETIEMGQLFDVDHLERLSTAPAVSSQLSDDRLYTLIMTDTTSMSVMWFVANVASNDGQVEIRQRPILDYHNPLKTDKPEGVHVCVIAVFEQKQAWRAKAAQRMIHGEFKFAEFLENNSDTLEETPLAATFFGYSTLKDDRKYLL